MTNSMTSDDPTSDNLTAHRRAHALVQQVLDGVPADRWDDPSRCTDWSVRDVVGHLVWGRDLLVACARGQQLDDGRGAPGAVPTNIP